MDLREKITLEPDPVWTDRYEAERELILELSGKHLLGVFHVGSTAIPDLAGKPALDVLAVFPDYEPMRALADALTDDGYETHADDDETILAIRWGEDQAVFVKMHLQGDRKVRDQLLFRDYLRENPVERREYERAKRDAASEHPTDPKAYTRAKSEVVSTVLERAREEGYTERLPEFVR